MSVSVAVRCGTCRELIALADDNGDGFVVFRTRRLGKRTLGGPKTAMHQRLDRLLAREAFATDTRMVPDTEPLGADDVLVPWCVCAGPPVTARTIRKLAVRARKQRQWECTVPRR